MPPTRLIGAPRRCFPALTALCVVALGCLASTSQAQPVAHQVAAGRAVAVAPASDPGIEGQFISRINSLRASKGLGQLQVSGELTGVARRWTDRMVAAGQISHNPNLASEVSGNWTKLGENVGVGYDVDSLMQAFINSPAHYRNLVDPDWTHLGVGVTVAADGRIYTTHNFMALAGQSAPPPPPPPPPPSSPTTERPSTATTAPPASPTTTTPPAPPEPHPTAERVTAVLDPLRSLEDHQ
jgi:uncharacterized protein YkwD